MKTFKDEIQRFIDYHVFELVERPANKLVISTKWACRYKHGSMNEVLKRKARLVAHGFTQRYGLDYKETYACTIKPVTYRTLLALAAFFDLEIEQVDFLSAYLHSDLNEETYVEQPKGFEVGGIDNKGKCRLV